MKRKDYSDFDIVSFLEDNDIYHRSSGKNVGKNYVGFRCPFCEGDGEHGGVSLIHKGFSCWQCAESASPPKLIKQILNCSWAKAYEILRKYSNREAAMSSWANIPTVKGRSSRPVHLPALTGPLTGPGGHYLSSRGFNPEAIEAKYGVKESGPLGDYKFRLIIPIYFKKELVSFTSRDYTGKGEPKYKAQPVDEAMIPANDCLYNIDTVKDDLLIVEGPADVWRMGDGAVALFGLSCSVSQQEMLFRWWMHVLKVKKRRHKKRVVMLLDPKTKRAADKIYYALTSFIRDIKIIELEGKDPAELTQQEAMNLKKDLFA
jgi:DNA primase